MGVGEDKGAPTWASVGDGEDKAVSTRPTPGDNPGNAHSPLLEERLPDVPKLGWAGGTLTAGAGWLLGGSGLDVATGLVGVAAAECWVRTSAAAACCVAAGCCGRTASEEAS